MIRRRRENKKEVRTMNKGSKNNKKIESVIASIKLNTLKRCIGENPFLKEEKENERINLNDDETRPAGEDNDRKRRRVYRQLNKAKKYELNKELNKELDSENKEMAQSKRDEQTTKRIKRARNKINQSKAQGNSYLRYGGKVKKTSKGIKGKKRQQSMFISFEFGDTGKSFYYFKDKNIFEDKKEHLNVTLENHGKDYDIDTSEGEMEYAQKQSNQDLHVALCNHIKKEERKRKRKRKNRN